MKHLLTALTVWFLMLANSATFAADKSAFLPPAVAFAMSLEQVTDTHAQLRFHVEPGHYLYADKFKFTANQNTSLAQPTYPDSQIRHDQFSGKEKTVYQQDLVIKVPFKNQGQPFELTARIQGCAEAGLCYPPFTQKVSITPTGGSNGGNLTLKAAQSTPAATSTALIPDESSRVSAMLTQGSLIITLLSFFGFGLLLALTPCVFPMIPILSGIIIGQGHTISKKRALSLSTVYVLGMAVTYAIAGVLAGMSGTLLSAALQNVWVLSGFAVVFVVLSLSMFDVYQLQLPASMQSKLNQSANQQGGSVTGVALMGALSALIVGPCVAAPLAGALLYIAKTGDALLGGLALFAMALGMGVPLIIIGVAARSFLPKAGGWMNGVKRVFGILLLAVAIWIVSPVASPLFIMLAVAALALGTAALLHAFDPLPVGAATSQRMSKALGIASSVLAISMLVGVLSGSRNPMAPLANLGLASQTPPQTAAPTVAFKRVSSQTELQAAISQSDKPIFLDFYADWCVSCKELEHFTFTDSGVQQSMEAYTLVQLDVTDNTDDHKEIMTRFDLFGPPAVILLTPKGEEVSRTIGYEEAATFKIWLDKVTNAITQSGENYTTR